MKLQRMSRRGPFGVALQVAAAGALLAVVGAAWSFWQLSDEL